VATGLVLQGKIGKFTVKRNKIIFKDVLMSSFGVFIADQDFLYGHIRKAAPFGFSGCCYCPGYPAGLS
jgi:hypothetical protein